MVNASNTWFCYPCFVIQENQAGVLDGPQIRALECEQDFIRKMNDKERNAWLSFVAVMESILSREKADNFVVRFL